MIDIKELNPHDYPTTPVIDKNLEILFERLCEAQAAYGVMFKLTSGLRSDAQQALLIQMGKSKAKFSKHLIGAAADVYDPDGHLGAWVMDNLPFMAGIGLWVEDPKYTPGWVHFQCVAPKSGNRVFIP